MIGPFEVEWTDAAIDDWKRMSSARATLVATAVRRFAALGEGTVVCVEGTYMLFVDDLVVLMLVDGDTLWIDRVRRA